MTTIVWMGFRLSRNERWLHLTRFAQCTNILNWTAHRSYLSIDFDLVAWIWRKPAQNYSNSNVRFQSQCMHLYTHEFFSTTTTTKNVRFHWTALCFPQSEKKKTVRRNRGMIKKNGASSFALKRQISKSRHFTKSTIIDLNRNRILNFNMN